MDKLVFAKEVKTGRNANGIWPQVYDQDGTLWNIFRPTIQIEQGKAYLFTYHTNEKGFSDIDRITPVVNIFKQEALKEVSNRNDIIKNLTVCLSYAKDLVIADKLPLADIENQTLTFYNFLQLESDKVMAELNKPKEDTNDTH